MKRPLVIASVLALAVALGVRLLGDGDESQADAVEPVSPAAAPAGAEAEPAALDARVREVVAAPTQSEAPVAESVAVRVVAAGSYGRDAERFPGVAFELLVDGDGDGSGTIVHAGRTAEDGTAEVELALDDPAALFAQLAEPGYQERRAVARSERADDGARVITLLVRAGATARGRVVDRERAPFGAEVRLMHWVEREGVPALGRSEAVAHALADGRFALHLDEGDLDDGVPLALFADGGDAGTGVLGGLALALDDLPQDLEIVVAGPGVVRGRVVDASGAPAAALDMRVLLAELDQPQGSSVLPEPLAGRRKAEGGGRLWVALVTDADGRFDARGLRPERYVVRARRAGGTGGYRDVLTAPGGVLADGAELRLVHSRSYLAVRLLDADGQPRTGEHPTAEYRRYRAFGAPSEWPQTPSVLVARCLARMDEATVDGAALEGAVLSRSEVVFELSEPGRYVVGAIGGGYRGDFTVVDAAPGSGRLEAELRAAPPQELGAAHVRVFHGNDEIDGDFGQPAFRLYLEHVETAAVLLARDERGSGPPFRFDAPPGRYRLVAEGEDDVESYHGTLMRGRELDRVEQEIVLVAGDTIDVQLALGAGARLEVTLEGEPPPVDVTAQGYDESQRDWHERIARSATLRLHAPGRRPSTVVRTVEWTGSSAAGPHLTSLFELGATSVSQVVPSGRYELVATLQDGRTAMQGVELVAGEALPVTLRFEARDR